MKRKNYGKLFGVFLAAAIFSASFPVTAAAEVGFSKKAAAEPVLYGATGYPIVVPDPNHEGFFLQTNQVAEAAAVPDVWFAGNTGLYELNGKVVYLLYSQQQKTALVTYNHQNSDGTYTPYTLYCDQEGRVMEYKDETKDAIDADISAHLAKEEEKVLSFCGATFRHRDVFSTYERYCFAKSVSDSLHSYPEGSIPLIADATKAATGKALRFQSIFTDSIGNRSVEWVDGNYDYQTNIVQTSGSRNTTAHELGHGMESTLNKTSGGRLREDFNTMNGGAAYNLSYWFAGDPELYGNQPPCFQSSYSATSFSEDFADTFSDALCYTTAELEEMLRYEEISAEYFAKIRYVKQLFNQYAGSVILQ